MNSPLNKVSDVNIYKMLSDESRLKIIKLLSQGEMDVSTIIDKLAINQSLVSHKLKELRENGLVISYRSGKNIIYKISDDLLKNVVKTAEDAGNRIETICRCVECNDEKI